MFGEQSELMIIIWCIMTSVIFITLITSIVLNLKYNKSYRRVKIENSSISNSSAIQKKENNKDQDIQNKKTEYQIFTPRKVAILSTFLAILIVQTLIDVYVPSFPGMPSFESMTTIAVGFIFGPIEGIIFGWTADALIVLLHGWTYQILPGMMMPMFGLIAGLMGMLFRNKDSLSKWKSIVIFQVTMIILMIIMLVTSLTIVDVVGDYRVHEDGSTGYGYIDAKKASIIAPISCSVSIVILEIIFFVMLYKKVASKDIYLITLLLVCAILERTIELVVRPFSQAYYYSYLNYFIEFYIRLLRSSYLIPCVSITTYALIKTSMYVLDYN